MTTTERIIEIISERGEEKSALSEQTRFSEDLGFDSLDVLDVTMAVEGEYNIIIPDDVYDGMKTVGDLVKAVDSMVR